MQRYYLTTTEIAVETTQRNCGIKSRRKSSNNILHEPLFDFSAHVIPRLALLLFVLWCLREEERFFVDYFLTRQKARIISIAFLIGVFLADTRPRALRNAVAKTLEELRQCALTSVFLSRVL